MCDFSVVGLFTCAEWLEVNLNQRFQAFAVVVCLCGVFLGFFFFLGGGGGGGTLQPVLSVDTWQRIVLFNTFFLEEKIVLTLMDCLLKERNVPAACGIFVCQFCACVFEFGILQMCWHTCSVIINWLMILISYLVRLERGCNWSLSVMENLDLWWVDNAVFSEVGM